MDILIAEPITNATVNRVLFEILERKNSEEGFIDESLMVYVNSPGGDVEAGYALYEILKLTGRKIYTYAINEVFSCAVVIYLAGDERYATNRSNFMIHEPYHELESDENGVNMTTSTYKKNLKELEDATNEYFKLIAQNTDLTPQKIRKNINKTRNGDWYFRAEMAQKLGLVTEIGVPIL